jgi:lysophospholipase L1-like esterase
MQPRRLGIGALWCLLACATQGCGDDPMELGAQSIAGASGGAGVLVPPQAGSAPAGAAGAASLQAPGAAAAGGSLASAAGQGANPSRSPAAPAPAGAGAGAASSVAAGSGAAGMLAAGTGAAGMLSAGSAAMSGTGAAGSGVQSANPTLYIAGDSTVMTYTDGSGLEGWGQELGPFFDTRVTIVNKAIGGRSVAFFMYQVEMDASGNYACADSEGRPKYKLDANGKRIDTSQWSAIKKGMKAGDFLLVQFGHNDETHTCPRYVSTSDYEVELGNMADIARAQGATPIFVTPMGHRAFDGSKVRNTLLPYANAMKDEAQKKMVEVVDLNLRSVEYYEMVGDAYLAANIFDGGTTHFHKQGAIKLAELIAGELRKNAGPLAAYLK